MIRNFILMFLGIIGFVVGFVFITSLEMPWLLRFILCVVYGWWLGGFIGKELAK